MKIKLHSQFLKNWVSDYDILSTKLWVCNNLITAIHYWFSGPGSPRPTFRLETFASSSTSYSVYFLEQKSGVPLYTAPLGQRVKQLDNEKPKQPMVLTVSLARASANEIGSGCDKHWNFFCAECERASILCFGSR